MNVKAVTVCLLVYPPTLAETITRLKEKPTLSAIRSGSYVSVLLEREGDERMI